MSEKMKKNISISLVFLVVGLDLLFGPGLLYFMKSIGVELCSNSQASIYPIKCLLQWGILSIYPAILALILWKRRKQDFIKDMYLQIRGKKQKIFVIILSTILLIMTVVMVIKTDDFLFVALNLLFFLVPIALAEEFVIRGVCPFLLRDCSKLTTYILPNILFAGLHIFAYNNFQTMNIDYVVYFLSSQMIRLFLMGLFFQLLKDFSGTLWAPILLHAIIDL